MWARLRSFSALIGTTITAVCLNPAFGWAQQSTEALAAAAQNPVAAMISLPFQNNTFFNAGPNHDKTANVLNIQPVLPFTVGDWNIISRTIVPLITLPSLTAPDLGDVITGAPSSNDPFGLGDINQTFYFSPAAATKFIWGIGPSMTLPTATSRFLGPRTLSMGPGAVGLVMPKPWVIGALARQLWAVAGPNQNVNQSLLQPFINYNFPTGWYLVSSPVMTANWSAPSSQRWSIPVGGGVGKIFKIDGQAMNASLQAFDYVAHPNLAPRWAIRFQVHRDKDLTNAGTQASEGANLAPQRSRLRRVCLRLPAGEQLRRIVDGHN